MTDFFKFRNSLEEAKCGSKNTKREEEKLDPVGKADGDIDNDGDVDSSDEYLKNRRKAISKAMKKEDEDGPCWKGYKQVGTKMKDGKEVPNCVPEETQKEQASKLLESKVTDKHFAIVKKNGSFYSDRTEIKKIISPSRNGPSLKTIEKHGGDAAIRVGDLKQKLKNMRDTDKLMKQLSESYYDYPDYGPIGASEMAQTQLHFIKYAADDITRCLKSGCPMPEWYQNKLAKIEGDMEGLYSYMKGKTRKMKAHQSDRYGMMGMGRGMYEQTLTEAKSGDKEAYTKFFNKALKKFGVDSPAELKGEKEKEFYDYVDKNWKSDNEKNESYINEVLKPSDDVSKWIEDFRASDAPQFKGKDKEERREMAVAAWLDARREAGYDVGPNPNE